MGGGELKLFLQLANCSPSETYLHTHIIAIWSVCLTLMPGYESDTLLNVLQCLILT